MWAIGYHWMKINPAVLMGGVAGARSHSGPAREAAKEIGSSVPWIGFPVGYAVSGVLLTVFGYLAMVLSSEESVPTLEVRIEAVTVELDLIHTILLAMVVLFVGRALVAKIGVLQRFSIPAPVVGGGLVAILLRFADGLGGAQALVQHGAEGLAAAHVLHHRRPRADARMLTKGGIKLLVFLAISAALMVVQNIVGIGAALALDLHPVIGLFGGSITLVGGHGTGAAYAGRLGETMNLQGVMELAMAAPPRAWCWARCSAARSPST